MPAPSTISPTSSRDGTPIIFGHVHGDNVNKSDFDQCLHKLSHATDAPFAYHCSFHFTGQSHACVRLQYSTKGVVVFPVIPSQHVMFVIFLPVNIVWIYFSVWNTSRVVIRERRLKLTEKAQGRISLKHPVK